MDMRLLFVGNMAHVTKDSTSSSQQQQPFHQKHHHLQSPSLTSHLFPDNPPLNPTTTTPTMQKSEAPAQAMSGANISKRRKFVADGVFYAELNEFFQRELAEEGYSGVEVRVTPTVTDIIIRATHTQEVLGEQGRRIREVCLPHLIFNARRAWMCEIVGCY